MRRFSPLSLPLTTAIEHRYLSGLVGAATSLCIAQLAKQHPHPTLLLTHDANEASRLFDELRYLCQAHQPVMLLPDREILPYDAFSPHEDITSDRLSCLTTLTQPATTPWLLIVPITNALIRLPPPQFLQHVFQASVGDTFDLTRIKQQLSQIGYHSVEQVYAHGEFAVRGAILDVFPMGSKQPYRIELFDDLIETIRTFDVDTQRSGTTITTINILPAKEFPTDAAGIETFRHQYRAYFKQTPQGQDAVYHQVSKGHFPSGIEAYLPLFFEATVSLFDYLPATTQILLTGEVHAACEQHLLEVNNRYQNYNVDPQRPLLAPTKLYFNTAEFFQMLKAYPQAHLHPTQQPKRAQAAVAMLPNLAVDHKQTNPLAALDDFVSQTKQRILLCVESPGRREILHTLLQQTHLCAQNLTHWQDFQQGSAPLGVIIAPFNQGCIFEDDGIVLISENELFQYNLTPQRKRRKSTTAADAVIRDLAELQLGQPVVHLEHGIGLYQGLEILTQDQLDAEYIKLEYAQEAIVYIPITSLHLINRYSGQHSDQVVLSRLGNDQWRKEKRRAQEQIRDVAAELLDIYAQRQATTHEKISFPMAEYNQFARQFPFEETPDQLEAIEAVLADLQREQPLDRLICGDVGFGKTEVAMRAAFACVQAHKQVAILVPTTLLAQQHYQNFIDRFADWPVNIAVLSRFKTAHQQKEILQQLQQHQVDIVIGTHKLLQDNIQFADLGLLIVDEEHRFGVRHKEKIKQLRAAVNILTMTATPIPRTLNMAMAGIRDLSIIATPPKKRLSIKTFVKEKNNETIKEAILRETLRGGQVFYLHNDVQSIALCQQQLQALIPSLRIGVAHGQMPEKELENIMNAFYHHRYDVLICTTIIETGIDIPKANTIVIDQANNFGLAQLHQLRGRVGRSHHQAYAYLLIHSVKLISKEAMQRLEAISNFDQLGAGFLLANQDLEIRGAGDFLGENQSGHMAKIGFSLYMDMLEEAVAALKQGREPSLDQLMQQQTEVDLGIPALFPEDFIRDTQLRLSLYKRIAHCQSSADLDDLQVEVIDRFGLLPQPTQDLFTLSHYKIRATWLGINKLSLRPQYIRIEFQEKNKINPQYIIKCLQSQPNTYKMDNATTLKWFVTATTASAKMQLLATLMTELEANCIRETA